MAVAELNGSGSDGRIPESGGCYHGGGSEGLIVSLATLNLKAAGTEGTAAACIGSGNREPLARSGSAHGTRLDWATMQPHYTHSTSHNGLEIDAMCCTSQGWGWVTADSSQNNLNLEITETIVFEKFLV